MSKQVRYFNFPIQLLEGFLENTSKCLRDISNYAVYEHSLKMKNAKEMDRFIASANYYGIEFGNSKASLINGKELYNSIPLKSPKTGISVIKFHEDRERETLLWWDYVKKEKTEFDKVCLLGFLALKSIVQQKAYSKTNNKLWLLRMDGKAKNDNVSFLSDSIKKYDNEYQTKKIKTKLQINWGLVSYSYKTRGFYISFKMNRKDLAFQAENKKHSNKVKQLKEQDKQAREQALLRIQNNTTNTRP